MKYPTTRPAPRALTASASRLRGGSQAESGYGKRMALPWQYQALTFYDLIPELHFASHFLARMMSRVRYYPATLTPQGELEEIKEGAPVQILNRIQDPGGGRSQLQYRYGLLSFITGEGILFGYRLGTPVERWKFLWKDEVKIREDGIAVRLTFDKRETSEVGIGYRFWTPHPKHSDLADSPIVAVTQICEELIALTASVQGTAITRLTNGMLLLPQELSPNPAEPIGDEDALNNIFLADMAEHFQQQIENPGTASAKVPFVLEGSYDYVDRVKWIQLHDPQTDYAEKELRKEAIWRLALGMDMPPEALLGMTDANHWTAKQVMHDMWRSHGIPRAEQFADDLAEAYLRPALEAEGVTWENVVVAYDDSQVVISPDRTDDADKALDRIAISFAAYRELKGFNEDMAPSDDEKEFLASLKLRQPVEIEGGDLIIPQRGPAAQPQTGGDASDGPPAPSNGRAVSRQESRTASAHILGAADLALLRCRELAGIRIRHKCKDCADGHPNTLVASILGPQVVGDPIKLVQGGADGLESLLIERGFSQSLAASLRQTLEVFAARTLFDSKHPSLPAAFMAQIENAQEVQSVYH